MSISTKYARASREVIKAARLDVDNYGTPSGGRNPDRFFSATSNKLKRYKFMSYGHVFDVTLERRLAKLDPETAHQLHVQARCWKLDSLGYYGEDPLVVVEEIESKRRALNILQAVGQGKW